MRIENKSIEILENDFWKELKVYPTSIVERAFLLRKKKISDLNLDEMRFLITQKIGVEILVPIVIKKLNQNVLLEGKFFPGDVLISLFQVSEDYWNKNPYEKLLFKTLLINNEASIRKSDLIDEEIRDKIIKYADVFVKENG